MIETAIPPELRDDPSILQKFQAANQGDAQALQVLYERFLDRIADPDACDLLRQSAHHDASAREKLNMHFQSEVKKRVNTILYPPPDAVPTHESTLTTDLEWSTLEKNIRRVAQRLWRDNFLDDTSLREVRQRLLRTSSGPSARSETLAQLALTSRQLMQLWLRTSLLRMRAVSNFEARDLQNTSTSKGNRVRKRIARIFREYHRDMNAWDRELLKLADRRYFRAGFFDAQQFKTIGKEFGPDKLNEHEDGWAAQAPDAQAELRFQAKDEQRRERWRAGKRVSASWNWVLKVTTGYGTKPSRFLWSVAVAILAFGAAFFANDALNPGLAIFSGRFFCAAATPHIASWYDVGNIFIRYLYLGVTNLSSLGSNTALATYCPGPSTQVLITVAALSGYFLLALLASLFFKQLTESE